MQRGCQRRGETPRHAARYALCRTVLADRSTLPVRQLAVEIRGSQRGVQFRTEQAMPNTLAHLGIQGVATRALIPRADWKWIFVGCIIPDVPWILQPVVRAAFPGIDAYDVRLYAIVMASLACCLLLCGVLALLSERPRLIFTILSLNALFHLLLDALQTKWGSGVHFFAPFSWSLANFGVFWPESPISYVLTLLGLVCVFWVWRQSVRRPPELTCGSRPRTYAALGLLVLYLLAPVALHHGPEARDNHSILTLRNREARAGKRAEFDREYYMPGPDGPALRTFAGEELPVLGALPDHPATVSARARFLDNQSITVLELHEHPMWARNVASAVGLALVAAMWSASLLRYAPASRAVSGPHERWPWRWTGRTNA